MLKPDRRPNGAGGDAVARPAGRWRARLAVAAVVVGVHLLLLDGIGRVGVDATALAAAPAALSVRTVPAPVPAPTGPIAEAADEAGATAVAGTAELPTAPPAIDRPAVAPPVDTRTPPAAASTERAPAGRGAAPPRTPTTAPAPAPAPAPLPAAVRSPRPPPASLAEAHPSEPARPVTVVAPVDLAPAAGPLGAPGSGEPTLAEAAAPAPAPAAAGAGAAPAPGPGRLLADGEQPPPVYRTALPPAATLRYAVHRGLLRGSGEIHWQPSAGRYRLHLEARIGGLTLLAQTSEGGIDGAGLAPDRFVDRRARRSPQAANFRRDTGTVTFSGPSTAWPLLAGTQDRLSWMIQLAGIAAADPGQVGADRRVTMVVVGARGDASVWTLRSLGADLATTAAGAVPAIHLVRDDRSPYDPGYDIWLDPARGYLPVHASQRNSRGEAEFELVLEAIEPGP